MFCLRDALRASSALPYHPPPSHCVVRPQIAILAFAWKCEASKALVITRAEFQTGMRAVGCVLLQSLTC
jgi:hypothetical protein